MLIRCERESGQARITEGKSGLLIRCEGRAGVRGVRLGVIRFVGLPASPQHMDLELCGLRY